MGATQVALLAIWVRLTGLVAATHRKTEQQVMSKPLQYEASKADGENCAADEPSQRSVAREDEERQSQRAVRAIETCAEHGAAALRLSNREDSSFTGW